MNEAASHWNRPYGLLFMGQLLILSLLSGVPAPPFPSSLLLSFLFVRIEVVGCEGPRPVEASQTRAPQTSSALPLPGSTEGEGWPGPARPRELHFP